MRRLALIVLLVVGCQPGSGTPSNPPSAGPSESVIATYPERLLADLSSTGVEARIGQVFVADPFKAQGFLVCVGSEQLRMYVFPSIGDRVEAAAAIDTSDPSNLGTAMVTWNGRPRLWQVDRLILAYLGEDAATEASLRDLLGPPFASGEGRVLLPDPACV